MQGVADEREILAAHQAGDLARAVELGLSIYGQEVYSFLFTRLRSASDVDEVFSILCEDLWRGVGGFAWRCSFRTWFYTLARNAALRFERAPANDPARRARWSQISEPVARIRSRTRPFLRTDVKDRFAPLRASLEPEERTLLTLRVDRGLSWGDVARIVHDAPEADEDEIRRLSTNLRQRFRKLTKRIEQLARAEGLLDTED